jgi:hypothetical protein
VGAASQPLCFATSLTTYRYRTTETLTDRHGVVIGLLLGLPPADSDDFEEACRLAHDKLLGLEPTLRIDRKHRRGEFAALGTGVSYGGGQKEPGLLCHKKANQTALEEVLAFESFERIAGHQSCESVCGFSTPLVCDHR